MTRCKHQKYELPEMQPDWNGNALDKLFQTAESDSVTKAKPDIYHIHRPAVRTSAADMLRYDCEAREAQ